MIEWYVFLTILKYARFCDLNLLLHMKEFKNQSKDIAARTRQALAVKKKKDSLWKSASNDEPAVE